MNIAVCIHNIYTQHDEPFALQLRLLWRLGTSDEAWPVGDSNAPNKKLICREPVLSTPLVIF